MCLIHDYFEQDRVMDKVLSIDSKQEPEVGHFSILKISNQIIQMLALHHQSYDSQILSLSPTVHRDMSSLKSIFFSEIENKLNGLIQKRITITLNWIEIILSKQKKTDYNMKEGLLHNIVSTSTCNQIIGFLKKILDEARENLDDGNRDAYLLDIGVSLCK